MEVAVRFLIIAMRVVRIMEMTVLMCEWPCNNTLNAWAVCSLGALVFSIRESSYSRVLPIQAASGSGKSLV